MIAYTDADEFDPGEFIFLRKPGGSGASSIRVAVPADVSLDDLLEEFAAFVKACGYMVPTGSFLEFLGGIRRGRPGARGLDRDGRNDGGGHRAVMRAFTKARQ